MNTRCDECGRRFDRPGFGCEKTHTEPDAAQELVEKIEHDLRNRRGLRHEFENIDEDIQDEIRDQWARFVCEVLSGAVINA